ncbi:MAG: S8 family serine peptidase [Planctomycetota bacterium]|nr:S8 family serine peptidase [Planctomycetota bacterium]
MRVVTLAAELWARGRTKRGSKGRRVQFEPLEVRALLSVSPAGGLDALGPDPAVSVLAASAMSGQTTPCADTLTAEQAQVREDLHALLSRGGTIGELEGFQPVLMPEAFLDELYDTYGPGTVWTSLGGRTLVAMFGNGDWLNRPDTPNVPQPLVDESNLSLSPEQASVRETVHDHISRGGSPYDLIDFRPVRMPEAFLDELYDTYGTTKVWDSLGWNTLADLFGADTLIKREDTQAEFHPDPSNLTDEQYQVREQLHQLLSRGGTIGELEGFQPVLMPEAFLDELYDTYGDDLVWDSLGPATMGALFGGETLIRRDETRYYLSQSLESLQPEQTRVREELHGLLSRGGKIEELEDFQPVLMPEEFLDELYDTYGDDLVWDSLGPGVMDELFGGETLIWRDETRYYLSTIESLDLIDVDQFELSNPAIVGAGYAVAVIDSAFDLDHPCFGADGNSDGVADRIVYQYDFADNDANADSSDYYSTVVTGYWHGTHVASIVASSSATRRGVATGVDLILLKVSRSSDGQLLSSSIEAALQWVAENVSQYNIVAVNMSFGHGRFDQSESGAFSDEIGELTVRGVSVVAAAGNDHGPDSSDVGIAYPAADINAIAVGAVYDANVGEQVFVTPTNGSLTARSTQADRITSFTQRGSLLDVMAPGSRITSAVPGGGFGIANGTSMAVPHVAGTVALAQQLAMQELGRHLSPTELRNLMQDTGVDVIDSHTAGGVGGNEDDVLTGTTTQLWHTESTYPRLNVSALGDAIAAISPTVYNAGARANNGIADTFILSRSGGNLVLERAENDVVWSTVNIPIAGLSELQLAGSDDADSFIVYNLGDFAGVVNIQGVETASVTDSVQIYDTPGDDVWDAREGYGSFQMEDAYRVTVSNVYAMHGYANAGGYDRAYLSGNAGANKLKTYDAGANIARIYLNGVYSRAKFFDSVNIYGNGGNDEAIVYDTPGSDLFKATKDDGQHVANDGAIEYNYFSFETVTAHAGAGNRDTARFSDSALREEVRARPGKVEVRDIDTDTVYLTMRNFDHVYAEALTDDGKTDIMKMHDNGVATIDLLFAEMANGQVHAEYYYNPADYYSPQASEMIYESLGFEITKGYSAYGPDKKDTDGVNPALLAWDGLWDEI